MRNPSALALIALLGAVLATPFLMPSAPLKAAPSSSADTLESPPVPLLQGSLVLKSMPLSPLLKRKITTWIYLPPGYNNAASAALRYPVVYLLHGQPGGWTDAYRSGRVEEMADALISARQMPPVILVAFEGGGPRGARDLTNFVNRVPDNYRVEDFMVQELVPYIDQTYRTQARASQRALWGYSSGGYGALNLGLKHPDVWNVLASHAGFYSANDDAEVMTQVLGPRGPLWDQNNTLLTVKSLPPNAPLHVYMDASPAEDGFDEFQALSRELQARHIELQTAVLPKAHAWRLIVKRCRDSLLFIGRAFNAANVTGAKDSPDTNTSNGASTASGAPNNRQGTPDS